MGAGVSVPVSAPREMNSEALAEAIFADLHEYQCEFGNLPVDELVFQAKCYFDSQPTRQPEQWIRSIIAKRDENGDGWISQHEFALAIDALRRC